MSDYPIQDWENGPAGGTPLEKARLAHIEWWLGEAHRLHKVGLGAADVAYVDEGQSVNSTSWSDLLTVGPEVTVDLDSDAAVVRAVVFVSAQLRSGFATGVEMGVEIIGPSPREPEQGRALRFRPHDADGDGYIQAAQFFPAFALSPGTYTFRAKYRSTQGLSGIVNHRGLLVIPLPR